MDKNRLHLFYILNKFNRLNRPNRLLLLKKYIIKKTLQKNKRKIKREKKKLNVNYISFESLGIEKWLLNISKTVNIKYPTNIQKICIPLILNGKNVIASAKTGEGKTICYCWPILQDLYKNFYSIFALILIPTRELVIQIAEQFLLYGIKLGVKILSCIGGYSIIDQRKNILNKPNIIIGTPGRISDLIENCSDIQDCFKRIKYLVLDEADLLLQKCFEEKLTIILKNIPKSNIERKTLFFSSTITESIKLIKETFPNNNLVIVDTNKKLKIPTNLEQRYIYIHNIAQINYLVYILKNKLNKLSGIIFVDNSYTCKLIHLILVSLKFTSVDSIHSQKEQKQRFSVISKFKNGNCKILVATDLISRGIDIPDISFVINFDFPNDIIQYIHRVGRTARANKKGVAISFIDSKDIKSFKNVKKIMKNKLKSYKLNKEEVLKDMYKIGKIIKKCQFKLNEEKIIEKENEKLIQYIHNE